MDTIHKILELVSWAGDHTIEETEDYPCCSPCQKQNVCSRIFGCGTDLCHPCQDNLQPNTRRLKKCRKRTGGMKRTFKKRSQNKKRIFKKRSQNKKRIFKKRSQNKKRTFTHFYQK